MGQEEKRQYLHLREIFESCYILALPFLDPSQGIGGVAIVRHAYLRLHESYPELTDQDLSLLVPALERVFHERSLSR